MAYLGDPLVEHHEQRVEFRTRKALALLVYLSVEGGRHSRESLATLFWPEADGQTGRARLRSTLYYLRQGLKSTGGEEVAAAYLDAGRDSLEFNFETEYELDVETLRRAADEDSLAPMQAAVELYRGDFLSGFALGGAAAFDHWAAERRQELSLTIGSILDRLSERLADKGDRRRALQAVQRWVHIDPWNEEARRRLIQLHAAVGDRAAALDTYEEFRQVLKGELGVEPEPQTHAMAERIRSDAARSSGAQAHRSRRPPIERLPFVGRGAEHELLVGEYQEARHGGPRLVLLEGEAGIGKSRLAQEWLRWAAANGAKVLQGRAFDVGGRVPYQPVLDALREDVRRANRRGSYLEPSWRNELARLFPEIESVESEEVANKEEADTSAAMFEAVAELVLKLSREQPVVLCLDDMQWADTGTRDLLTYVANRWQRDGAQIMLLLLWRDTNPDTPPKQTDWMLRVARDIPGATVHLKPLSQEETIAWIQRLAGGRRMAPRPTGGGRAASRAREQPSPDSGDDPWTALGLRLFDVTSGHPFFLTETLKGLLDRGVLRWRRAEARAWRIALGPQAPDVDQLHALEGLIAPSVRHAVRARLKGTTEAMFELLAAAAVLGQTAEFAGLCAVTGMSASEALLPLDQLIEGRLLQENPASKGPGSEQTYSFSHDQIRKVTYEEAGGARRRLFHRRAFKYISDRGVSSAELAHHARGGGLWEQAWSHNVQAGREAFEVFAVRDSIRYLEQARSILTKMDDPLDKLDPKELQSFYERLGRAYEIVNDWDRARAVYRTLLAESERLGSPQAEVSARLRLASLWVQQDFAVDRAAETLRQALAVAEACGDQRGLAEAEWRLSTVQYFRFRRDDALRHAQRAVGLARDYGDPALIAGSLNALGYARQGLAHWSGVEPPLAEAIELYREQGNRAMEVDCLLMLAVGRLHIGDLAGAMEMVEGADAQLIEADNPWGKCNSAWVRSTVLTEQARYQDAIEIASRALEIAVENEISALAVSTLVVRGMARRAVGRFELALQDHERAEDLLRQMSNPHFPDVLAPHLCIDLGMSGKWEQAAEHARVAVRSEDQAWLHSATWLCSGFHQWFLIQALLEAGEQKLARNQVQQFGDFAGQNPRYQIPAARSRAAMAEHEGEFEAMLEEVKKARDLSRELGLPGEELVHCLALLRRYDQVDNEPARRQSHSRAIELAQWIIAGISHPNLRSDYSDWLREQGLSFFGE